MVPMSTFFLCYNNVWKSLQSKGRTQQQQAAKNSNQGSSWGSTYYTHAYSYTLVKIARMFFLEEGGARMQVSLYVNDLEQQDFLMTTD
jgi:hypothetical protein